MSHSRRLTNTQNSCHYPDDNDGNSQSPTLLAPGPPTKDSLSIQPSPRPISSTKSPTKSPQDGLRDPRICISLSPARRRDARRRAHRGLMLTWRWEFSTWLLGTSAFTAIVVLLLTFKDEPLYYWKSTIQISTVVATLSQTAQTALLVPVSYCISQLKWEWFRQSRRSIDIDRFDLASRGPDGSARLLYHLAWKPHLVSLGALVTVLLLSFSSFVQQTLQINSKTKIAQWTNGQMSRITILPIPLDANAAKYRPEGGTEYTRQVDMLLSSAMKYGFLSSSVSPSDVHGQCGTDRCTWEPYHTLALCSYTEDISSSILFNTREFGPKSKYPDNSRRFNPEGFVPPSIPGLGPMFPNGSDPENLFMTRSSGVVLGQTPLYDIDGYLHTSNNSDSNLPDVAQVFVLYYDPCKNTGDSHTEFNPYGWKAFKGRLRMCVQTLNSSYDSTTRTEVIASHADLTWDRFLDESNHPMWCTRVPGEEDSFCFAQTRIEWLPTDLNTIFNGTVSVPKTGFITHNSEWGPVLVDAVLGPWPMSCPSESGHGFDGFTRVVTNIGNSISNAMRTVNGTAKVYGTAWESEQFIGVSFWWMSMPIALYVAITLFFLATVIKTRNAPPWKSSPLPLLSCTDPDNNLGSIKEINKDAMQTSMQLNATATGWHMLDTTVNRKPDSSCG